MSTPKNYSNKPFVLTVMVIAILLLLGAVPSFEVGGTRVKRINILSDVITIDDNFHPSIEDRDLLDTTFLEDMPTVLAVSRSVSDTMALSSVDTTRNDADYQTISWPTLDEQIEDEDDVTDEQPADVMPPEAPVVDGVVQIEDFSAGHRMMRGFYNALATQASQRVVRVAVMGDSFIEGDIITADMREQLQLLYGGSGVGFVPFASPISKYRGTVRHTFEGWQSYDLIKRKQAPEELRNYFCVTGNFSVPVTQSASAHYKGVNFRKKIDRTTNSELLFINSGKSVIDVSVNDSLRRSYSPPTSRGLQRIELRGPVSALDVTVHGGDGFFGYGVVLEDTVGVSVHNFAVRSNSGLALFGTDYDINRRLGELMHYDLIVLQYGLNAMSANVTNYDYYGRQLCKLVEYIKLCFPQSAIIVMSVGDRSTQNKGEKMTMPAVRAMIETQRKVAWESGVAFWNTFEAMGGENSMVEFVKQKWAAKDYTHIGYQGGRKIAGVFVRHISSQVDRIQRRQELRRLHQMPVLENARVLRSKPFGPQPQLQPLRQQNDLQPEQHENPIPDDSLPDHLSPTD